MLEPLVALAATVGTLGATCAGVALRLTARRTLGAVLLFVALALPLATIPFMLAALYAPIFDIAGKIRAD